MKFQAPRGTYDILPEDNFKWNYIKNVFKNVVKSYGYKELSFPIFESLDLFKRSVGETSDIVEKEMYVFEDKKGRTFALRPEGTASVARAYVEHNLVASSRDPLRLFYQGPMFRYSRPQKGRYRQFYQFGVECIGRAEALADAEIISIGWEILQQAKVPDVQLRINSVGCPKCRTDYAKKLKKYLFARKDKFCSDCQRRMNTNPMRVFDCKNPECKTQLKDAPQMLDYLCADCEEHFSNVKKYLTIMKVEFEVDPRIVRGLDYYTRTAFEYSVDYLGAQDALGGGGRYDGLIEYVGGKSTPAVGLSLGVERILLALEKRGIQISPADSLDVFIIPMENKFTENAIAIMKKLHNENLSAQIAYAGASIKSSFKFCDRNNVKFAIIIGANEVESGDYAVKDIRKRKQSNIKFNEISNYIKAKLT
ncbi:MAG: histidine--tRNA ligase [Candidatus Cloacimonadota bacterium]|nr:histidine--tRNA ligase [Candidatus Cloacimonadota bacterium]